MSREYTLAEVLSAAIETKTSGMHVSIPGIVEAYDKDAQTVDVTPAVQMPVRTLEGGVTYEAIATMSGVKVAWSRGGGYFFACALAKGDPVTLLFSDIPFGEYLDTGEISKPIDQRRHSLGYAIAIPGGAHPDLKRLVTAPASGCVVGKDGGDAQLVITDALIKLGASATDFVALASKVEQSLSDLSDWVKTGVAPSGGGTVTYAAPFTPTPTGATLTKAK